MEDEEATAPAAVNVFSSQVPLPSKLSITGDIANNWKKWKQIWTSFEVVTRLKDQSNEYRTATFITCIGPEGLEIYNGLPFANDADKGDIDKVIELMDAYCVGETNVIYERYIFKNREQESNESMDSYISSLRQLAISCDFRDQKDDFIRDQIVYGILDATIKKTLLQESKLTLTTAIEKC